jgi:hypothetical protein
MRLPNWKIVLYLLFVFLMPAITCSAQWQTKPYQEWSEKEVLKVLDDSPWGQTQNVADTSKMFGALAAGRGPTGEHEVPKTTFHIRFFSAKPIRQAVAVSWK